MVMINSSAGPSELRGGVTSPTKHRDETASLNRKMTWTRNEELYVSHAITLAEVVYIQTRPTGKIVWN